MATTGAIWADPQLVYLPRDGLGPTTIRWSTSDGSNAYVFASVNGEPDKLFGEGPSGSELAPWIPEGRAVFTLTLDGHGYPDLGSVTVQGVRAGSLSASQSQVAVPEGGTGATTISWAMAEPVSGELWVSVNGLPEALFASGRSGSQDTNWIQRGTTVFTLYRASDHRVIDSIVVSGVAASTVPGAPDPCDRSPVAEGARLTAGVGRGRYRRRVLTTRFGRSVRIRGRLSQPGGAPIAGAPVCVVARSTVAGGGAEAPQSVTTDAKGRFSYVLPPGSSRLVEFVHRTGPGAVSATVMVRVRAPLVLRASRKRLRNGQMLMLSGRVPVGGLPAGLLVELQARRRSRWQTFGTTNAGRRGRFRFSYRFTRTLGVRGYELGARLPVQPDFPFAASGSHPVHVRVIG